MKEALLWSPRYFAVAMVTMLGAVAMTVAVSNSHLSAVTRKILQSQAAGRSGVDAVAASVQAALASNGSLTCQSLSSAFNWSSSGSPLGASNAASGEKYDLWYYNDLTSTPPTATWLSAFASDAQQAATGKSVTWPSGTGTCSTSSATTVLSQTSLSIQSAPFYLAVASAGLSTSTANSWATKPNIAVFELNESVTSSFTDGLYGNDYINTPGNLQISGAGSIYTNGQLNCTSTNHYLSGDVWALGGVTSGDCKVSGNLYVTGAVSLTGCSPPDIYESIYSTGNVSMSGGCEVEGNIVSNGTVNFSGGADVLGNIYAFGANGTSNSCGTSTSVCLDSGAGQGSSYQADNVYSANGQVTVANAAIDGTSYSRTAWPSCPVPTGSGVTCSGGELATLPAQAFPSLTNNSAWSGTTVQWDGQTWNYINDQSDTCQTSTGSYQTGTAAKAIYSDIESATSPTLVVTPCAMWFDDFGGKLSGFKLNTNVAIFATGGFNFDNTISTWVTGTGSNDLYLVVPCSTTCATGTLPASAGARTEAKNCNPSSALPTTGDIWLSSQLASVQTFVYTPDNFCTNSSTSMTGQVYSGGYVDMSGGFSLAATTSLSSGLTTGSGWSASVTSMQ